MPPSSFCVLFKSTVKPRTPAPSLDVTLEGSVQFQKLHYEDSCWVMFVVPEGLKILHSCSIHTFLLYNSEVGGQKQTSEFQNRTSTRAKQTLVQGSNRATSWETGWSALYIMGSLELLDTILNWSVNQCAPALPCGYLLYPTRVSENKSFESFLLQK